MKSSTQTCMGLGIFYLDLHGVCIKFIKLALNVLKSYLLLFIHRLMILALTTNAIIIFIMYLYMYLLEFIVVSIFIQLECIYSICISTVFIGIVFIQFCFCFIYIFIHIYWVGSNFLFFSQYMCYKIY